MNNEITSLNDTRTSNTDVIQPISPIDNQPIPQMNNVNNVNNPNTDDYISFPDWDLTPPFDSIDRSDVS